MSDSSIVLSKDTVFVDELIRENARLTVQHEADQAQIRELRERASSDELEARLGEALAACDTAKLEAQQSVTKLHRAVADLHVVMAGGDPCKVCVNKCKMGDHCQPRWNGL